MPKPAGVLVIRILEAKHLIQTDSFLNKIDPFVEIQKGSKKKKTSVSSGNDPKWDNEIMEFVMEVPGEKLNALGVSCMLRLSIRTFAF